MAAKVGGWRIHLGAHKTATTHVQATLAAMASDLRRDGVAFLPCHAVRPILRDLGSWRSTHRLLGRDAVARRIEARLASLAADGSAAESLGVAFSDENVLGPLIDAMRRRPYPRLARRLGPLAVIAQGRPAALFLSIRSFDRLLAGAYATALRYRRLSPLIVRRRKRIFGRPPPCWTDVLDRIAEAVPGVPIRVWRQEDYARNPRPVLSAFLGREVEALPDLPPPPTTMTPSAEAIAEVERLIRAGAHRIEPEAWPRRVNEIYAERPARTGTPFQPIGPAEAARFAEAYAADVEAIRRDRPGWLIEP
jgi:hypothetical protein